MSTEHTSSLGWHRVEGTARETGTRLGVHGREAVHQHLLSSDIWRRVTSERHVAQFDTLARAVQSRFPGIWDEIVGLADGLEVPLDKVFAWNCRGDLLASVPDGCTTVLTPGPVPGLAHNEDGLPFFRDTCFIAEVRPDDAIPFHAFCYPGSLPGHTFAWTGAGLVQTVNNLRLRGIEAAIPRMVLGRAVLSAASLDEALAILHEDPSSGGFHMALAQAGDSRLVSVEFGGGRISVTQPRMREIHANHALHVPLPAAGQIITASSADRQQRGDSLAASDATSREIMNDRWTKGLPIRRDMPDDPDSENTLATVDFRVGATCVEWDIYDSASDTPCFKGRTEPQSAWRQDPAADG
ncbi:MAG: C45 family peptidase [Desulfomicrobium sp.]|uniref:C45 family autoproteolytic acyltransferase/hydolase n=1 Tax=Hoeflea sp. TaxID=1940281 RepID=UPI0025C114CE|nr:C45 family peptidase [Hoeflea sp.]MBU4528013.1 C45 family peptidase [Alphaproteobacteria bacterium]MBV1712612.1 C45 family peptidase [Desulfomicrobium sp.]MBU4542287.1 C45 family peptidase [Alphaproteobacteria bacterium]MBU4549009.1 C45 family peptidase [Alphaproteobacteria bacterium]MBV1783549.1 C45 family peptidase [Hoeflea sp.]